MQGQMAQAQGWLSRTGSIIEEAALDCTAAGYLLIPGLLGALGEGRTDAAAEMAVQATGIGNRLGDPDLCALGTLGHGQALAPRATRWVEWPGSTRSWSR
ncbi:MAG TPA: hypothetical protein VMZ73_02245 [Acidimicrobiales bacterium]|nr:hypothetical protein [Acidimicrobiales bacterium]